MKELYKPYDCDLREYEARLASSREIWDDYSHEWSYSTFDKKLVILAGFVQKGGNLNRAIGRYAEERSEIYRSRIHWVVFDYIWHLMMPGQRISRPTSDRIKCLRNDELLRLLTELLKEKVKKGFSCEIIRSRGVPNGTPRVESFENWTVDATEIDDTILDHIEREHWRTNPSEPSPPTLKKQSAGSTNIACFKTIIQ